MSCSISSSSPGCGWAGPAFIDCLIGIDEADVCSKYDEMVAYGKAKNDEQVRRHFETLQKMRPLACRELDEARYRYFQQWFYPMIRSALEESEAVHTELAEARREGWSRLGNSTLCACQFCSKA